MVQGEQAGEKKLMESRSKSSLTPSAPTESIRTVNHAGLVMKLVSGTAGKE